MNFKQLDLLVDSTITFLPPLTGLKLKNIYTLAKTIVRPEFLLLQTPRLCASFLLIDNAINCTASCKKLFNIESENEKLYSLKMIGQLVNEHYKSLPITTIIKAVLDNDKSSDRRLQYLNNDILSFVIFKSSNPVIIDWIGMPSDNPLFNLHQKERLQILEKNPSRVEYINNVLQFTSKNQQRNVITVKLIREYIIEKFKLSQRFDSSLIKYLNDIRDASIDILGSKSRLLNVLDSMIEDEEKKPNDPLYTDWNRITCPRSQTKNCQSYRVCPETFQDYC